MMGEREEETADVDEVDSVGDRKRTKWYSVRLPKFYSRSIWERDDDWTEDEADAAMRHC